MSARELADLTPTEDDVGWARQRSRSDEHLLALVLSLRCFARLGYFPRSEDVPAAVVDHVRRCLELEAGTAPVCGTPTAKLHRSMVRERLGVTCDPQRARAVAEDAIAGAALVKNHPPDLINVALEMLVKSSLELPGFATLDELAARIRHDVNTTMFGRVGARIVLPERIALEGLLDIDGPGSKSEFHRLKQVAGRASWSAFREQVAHLRWVDSLGDTDAWLEGIAESKIADFAGEAMAADAGVMRDVASAKRTALLACMVHVARRGLGNNGTKSPANGSAWSRHPRGDPGRLVLSAGCSVLGCRAGDRSGGIVLGTISPDAGVVRRRRPLP